jgi:hypothetical protein
VALKSDHVTVSNDERPIVTEAAVSKAVLLVDGNVGLDQSRSGFGVNVIDAIFYRFAVVRHAWQLSDGSDKPFVAETIRR